MGYLLVLIPILLAPLAFRRGVLLALTAGLLSFGLAPRGAQASPWADLWQTQDQQAQDAFEAGDFGTAAAKFSSSGSKGAAQYRAGDYAAASELFRHDSYYRGNALANAGALEQSLAAYDDALKIAPDDADARYNRDLVAKLLEQQSQEQESQQDQRQENQQQGDEQQPAQQNAAAEPGGAATAQDQQNESTGQEQSANNTGAPDQKSGQTDGEQAAEASKSPSSTKNSGAEEAGSGAQEQVALAANQKSSADQSSPQLTEENRNTPGSQTGQDTRPASAFSKLMDRVLGSNAQNGEAGQETAQEVAGNAPPQLDQAAEQQLRAVPDDPSGLLRARIRQHYARLRAASH